MRTSYRRISTVFSAMAFAALAPLAMAEDTLTMADFGHAIKLQVNGYTGESTLENFPVLVRISESGIPGFLYSDLTSSKGNDIAFFDAAGNHLASEIQTNSWKAVDNESQAWVLLPQMTNGTSFFMCYNTSESGVYVTNANPWTEYVGVWHLDEAGGKSKPVYDSTTNGLDGITSAKGSPAVYASGKVGKARRIATDTSNNPGYDCGITVAITNDAVKKAVVDGLTPEFTASFWYLPAAAKANYEYLLSRKSADGYNAWGLQFGMTNTTSVSPWNQIRVWGGNSGNYAVGTGATYGTGDQYGMVIPESNTTTWRKMDCVWTSDKKYSLYVDGVLVAAGALSGNKNAANGSLNLSIGGTLAPASGKGGRGFNGYMDEVRVRVGTRSADWIKADFDTVNDSSFVIVAPVNVLTVEWANAEGATPGVSDTTYNSATFGGTVQNLGEAASCDIEYKVWADGAGEPAGWTTLTSGLVADGVFSVAVSGLSSSTTYNYKLRAVGSDGSETETVSGTFATSASLEITWSSASGTTGFSHIAYDFATVSGTLTSLGGALECNAQYKIWEAGEDEPSSWTTFANGDGLGDELTANRTGLAPGTTYNYALRGVGDNDDETPVVSGTFTTEGNSGETIGSPDTHFFSDGTNSYWVANDFERYLPFTVTGYTGSETLTNFPVLVDVRKNDTNGFTYADFYRFNGEDIAFVDEKGHVIPHEIDTWNPNGMTLIWVKLPEMNNGTTFTMCYRSPLLNPPSDPGNTFEKYIGVWHMNEKDNGVVDVMDSTTNNLIGETHANSLADSNGRVGYARRIAQESGASSSAGRLIVFDHDNILRDVGPVFTYSGWYKLMPPNTEDPDWAYLVSRKSDDDSTGWGIQYHDKKASTDLMRVWAANEGKNKSGFFDIKDIGYRHDEWAYWTFVYSNQTFHAYFKGEELDCTATNYTLKLPVVNDASASYKNLVIGGMQNGKGAFNGLVDEARYSKGVRSADWIKAEYDSMLQVNTPFVTKGTQVGRGEESLVPVVVWETGEGHPETVVDVSYAYVQFAGTVTYCGAGADRCYIEYQLWADGEVPPGKNDWTSLLEDATVGTKFSIPVFGLKQDMPYNFRIRAANVVGGRVQTTREYTGSFRTNGNVNGTALDGELLRVDNKFVHRYPAGSYTFTTPDYVTNIEIMVVGGGGAGGYKVGGGGGGGGVFYSKSYAVTTNTTYRVNVGQGGTAATNTTTASSVGNGEFSSFALESDASHPLISVPGGGGGGNYSDRAGAGSDGASGGGGTYGHSGGLPVSNEVDGVWMMYGNNGGAGNLKSAAGDAKCAAGGGGGAGREGLVATSDNWYFGGAGGVGIACSMSGETFYFGAGGGGGYQYKIEADGGGHFSGPGSGGSGIGGNAADVRNGTLATSGVENTGAGGGGGSMTKNASATEDFWQGGDGGDGVVMIAYEVHGRDPISDEPRISMTSCMYDEDLGLADISYRVYWAGVQNDVADILIHYSTVGPEELDGIESGSWVKVAEGQLGVGSAVFTPPEVGHTYWVRLVARKDANSYAQSEEIASFVVPAVELNGVTWTESKTSPAEDHAVVSYRLFETNETTHLYCYWSESRTALEGNEPPTGDGVYLKDIGANTGTSLSSATSFNLPATEGLERNRTYFIRLASGDAQGIKRFLSTDIDELDTAEKPITVLDSATWAENVATVEFKATVGKLDPAETELVALYGLVKGDVESSNPTNKESVTVFSLGFCSDIALDDASPSAMFPLWSEVATNYYVRLALATNVVVDVGGVSTTNRVIVAGSYSQATKTLVITQAIEANTLIYIVTANPKVMCYGDEPLPLDYELEYAGKTGGWGWNNKYGFTGEIACFESTNPTPVAVSSTSPSGNYPIAQGTFDLVDKGAEKRDYITENEYVSYRYKLSFSGATYAITNAVFSTAIEDVVTNYTGEACDTSELVKTLSGVRNEQPVTYLYRVGGSGEWSAELPTLTDVGNYNVQFKATAPSHDDVRGSFNITIAPAPLAATITTEYPSYAYTGSVQTPVVATNVTGLVRPDLNALTCQFRDEAGEWQDDVPSFTMPGTYKIYFRASAPNHETFTTNCTFTITGWEYKVNMDGTTGEENAIDINVSDPGWLLRAKGITGEAFAQDVYGNLNEVQPNGLKLWQNYIIERSDLSDMLVATIHQNCQRVAPNCFELRFPDATALRNTGLDVKFRVDRKLKGEQDFTEGALTDKYEANVPLTPHDPTGLYVFNMVFVPTNELYSSQKSVISSVATVGVLRVSCALTNAVTVAPWLSMSFERTNKLEVAVTDVVNPNSLGTGDEIWVHNASSEFHKYELAEDGEWNSPVTVTTRGVSQSSAETETLAPGKAFWLVRKAPGPYIYLIGRYTGEDIFVGLEGGSAAEPGHTLVANPTFDDIELNDLDFVDGAGNPATPAVGDCIAVMDIAGMRTIYSRHANNDSWGYTTYEKVGRKLTKVWHSGGTVPAGTGFWYYRSSGETLRIKFEASR